MLGFQFGRHARAQLLETAAALARDNAADADAVGATWPPDSFIPFFCGGSYGVAFILFG